MAFKIIFTTFILNCFTLSYSKAEFTFYETRPSHNSEFELTETPYEKSNGYLNLNYQWLNAPVLSFTPDQSTSKSVYIDDVNALEFSFITKLNESWSFGADMSYFKMRLNDQTGRSGTNDLRLVLLRQRKNKESSGFSYLVEVYAPTGNKDLMLSSQGAGAGFLAIESFNFLDFEIFANFGVRYISKAVYQGIDRIWQVPMHIGVNRDLGSNWAAAIEGRRYFYPNTWGTGEGEMLLNVKKKFDRTQMNLGGAIGTLDKGPAVQYRLMTGIKYDLEEKAPIQSTVEVKTIQVINNCSDQPLDLSFTARPLRTDELEKMTNLPYKSNNPGHKLTTLNLGEMTSLSAKGIPYVKDSQVLMAFDLFDMPARKQIQKMHSAVFKTFLIKTSKEQTTRSEIFCFLGKNICSGELFKEHTWLANINQNFFKGKETPNDYFSRQYLNQSLGSNGGQKIYAADLTLDMIRLLENSTAESPLDILYDPAIESSDGKKTFYAVIADDTYVRSDIKLELKLSVNNCPGAKDAP